MLADVFITTLNRSHLLKNTLKSLEENTQAGSYRLTVVHDGDDRATSDTIRDFQNVDHVLSHRKNMGLGPSINQALSHIDSLRRWDEAPPAVTVYVQDDVQFSGGWLQKLSSKFLQLEKPLNLAFASGHSAVEHEKDPRAQTKKYGDFYTNRYIRATCMLARHETWMSMWPIPRVDPETGSERGRPHNGLGSGVDWHFVRVHQNSVVRTGRTNLIIPGLVVHNGFKESTWLPRELPESESDKKAMETK